MHRPTSPSTAQLSNAVVICTFLGGPWDGEHVVAKAWLAAGDVEAARVWGFYMATDCGVVGHRSVCLSPAAHNELLTQCCSPTATENDEPLLSSHCYEVISRQIAKDVVQLRAAYVGAARI